MNDAEIRADGDGCFSVTGPVVFSTAGDLLSASTDLFTEEDVLLVDLSGVTKVDSAALALVIEWVRLATRQGRRIQFKGIPERLWVLARMTGVEEIIKETTV